MALLIIIDRKYSAVPFGIIESDSQKDGDVVEMRGIEPLTSALRTLRSPN